MSCTIIAAMLNSYNSINQLIEKLVNYTSEIIKNSILEKEFCNIAISCDQLSQAFFQELSKENLNWDKVNITLCDEKCIDPLNLESNSYLIKTYLLKNYASKANFFPLFDEKISTFQNLLKTKSMLNNLSPFDLVILNLREDGSTASLFPNSCKLQNALTPHYHEKIIQITPQTIAYSRFSFTLHTILESKNILIYFEGEDRLRTFNKALKPGNHFFLPISSILNSGHTNIKILNA